jgi:hypothetical protein
MSAETYKIIKGMQILLKYYTEPADYFTTADYGMIIMSSTSTEVSEADRARLIDLGWFQQDADEDDDGNFIYSVQEDWHIYA